MTPRVSVAAAALLLGCLTLASVGDQYGAAAWRWILLHDGCSTRTACTITYEAAEYADDSSTGGIAEALAACAADDAYGWVHMPPGVIPIDATNITSPVLDLPSDAVSGINQARCHLRGEGDSGASYLTYEQLSGTLLQITNLEGKTAIRVNGGSQKLRDFTVKIEDADASTIGIDFLSRSLSGCGGTCVDGQFGIANWDVENVTVAGPAFGGPGIGVRQTFTLKGGWRGGEIRSWDDGLKLVNVSGYTTQYASNANVWDHVKFRESDNGIRLAGDGSCDDISLVVATVEGNQDGLQMDANTDCMVGDFKGHWEQGGSWLSSSYGAQIRMSCTDCGYYGFSPRFSGSVDTADIIRTTDQNRDGPDVVIGGYFTTGIIYSGGADIQLIGTRYIPNADGDVYGVGGYWSATDCPTDMAVADSHVSGDQCWEQDADQLYVCEPDADGVCDDAAEWIAMP